MGSDMMVTIAREVELEADAQEWCQQHGLEPESRAPLEAAALHARVDQLEITEDLTGIDGYHDITDETGQEIPFDAPEYDAAVARTIRAQLHNAVDVVTGRNREISTLLIDGTWWMATGGMSGGDLPTDAYEPISLIDAYKVTEKPITMSEISAAHQLAATI